MPWVVSCWEPEEAAATGARARLLPLPLLLLLQAHDTGPAASAAAPACCGLLLPLLLLQRGGATAARPPLAARSCCGQHGFRPCRSMVLEKRKGKTNRTSILHAPLTRVPASWTACCTSCASPPPAAGARGRPAGWPPCPRQTRRSRAAARGGQLQRRTGVSAGAEDAQLTCASITT